MWKLGLWPRNSFSGTSCFHFSVLVLCSEWKQIWTSTHFFCAEPEFVNNKEAQESIPRNRFLVRQPYLSYRPARLRRLAESIAWNRFLGSFNVDKLGLSTPFQIRNDDLSLRLPPLNFTAMMPPPPRHKPRDANHCSGGFCCWCAAPFSNPFRRWNQAGGETLIGPAGGGGGA
jgi:hypothetical protein